MIVYYKTVKHSLECSRRAPGRSGGLQERLQQVPKASRRLPESPEAPAEQTTDFPGFTMKQHWVSRHVRQNRSFLLLCDTVREKPLILLKVFVENDTFISNCWRSLFIQNAQFLIGRMPQNSGRLTCTEGVYYHIKVRNLNARRMSREQQTFQN